MTTPIARDVNFTSDTKVVATGEKTMRTILMAGAIAAGVTALAGGEALANTVIGNTPYLCFDRTSIAGCGTSDSPFATKSYSYFHLETFEDGLFNVPGVSAAGSILQVLAPGSSTNSVDGDDGVIDGSFTGGHSFFGGTPITFTFNAATLGALPTDVGIAFTDGVSAAYTIAFFDGGGLLLGSTTQVMSDGGRFFGWTGTTGVGSLRVTGGNGIELDHLQYGLAIVTPPAVPEPATWAMFIGGFGLIGSAMRRTRVQAVLA